MKAPSTNHLLKLFLSLACLLLLIEETKGKRTSVGGSGSSSSSSSTSLTSSSESSLASSSGLESSSSSLASSSSSGLANNRYDGGHTSYCCSSSCCSSGYKPGYSIWWYRGYRSTHREGQRFLSELDEARLALKTLSGALKGPIAATNGGTVLVTEDCAYDDAALSNNTTLSTDSERSPLATYFDNLVLELTILEQMLENEVDVDIAFNEWLNTYRVIIDTCAPEPSAVPEGYSGLLESVKTEVGDLESLQGNWELALASASSAAASTSVVGAMGIGSWLLLVLVPLLPVLASSA